MASFVVSSILSKISQVLDLVRRRAISPSSSSDPSSSVFEYLMEMRRRLKMIQAVLHDAEEREIRVETVKLWLEFKEVAYEVEDVLDEYQYEKLRAPAEGRASCKRKRVEGDDDEEVSGSLSKIVVSIPDEMGDKIKKIRERIDQIWEDRELLRLREEDGERILEATYPVPTSYMVDESCIFGRSNDKMEVIDLLLSKRLGNGVSVIAIVGMGGLGKTTIARLVYNDPQVKEYFDLTGWICASGGDFDAKRLTKEIIDSISSDDKKEEEKKEPSWDLIQLSTLQNDLKEKLEGKKVLLVLDDVWNEQRSLWKSLRKPFVGAESAVRIIVTCRNDKVARNMQTVSVFRPGLLSEDESWLLFRHYAFGGQDSQRQSCFERIGMQIVKKCSGLPLPVKLIGSSLRHEEDEGKWKEYLQSELWEVDENNEILPALKLSYDRMPVHLKPCFLYCSIFPMNFEFRKDYLVNMWMAQGYILPRGTRRMEDIGDEYFIDLQRRSFFDPVGCGGLHKMHDMVHGLAKFVAGNDMVRHLYVKDDEELVKSRRSCNPEALRTSLLHDECRDPIEIQNIIRLPRLRCLKFCWKRKDAIPDSLGNLKHLRYLDISSEDIEKLPESVCGLYHLQTLKLFCKGLVELPYDLGNLTNLRHLDLRTHCIKRLPESVCRLYHLQTLELVCDDLVELPCNLGNLTNLRHLVLLTQYMKRLPESLCQLHNLQELRISGCADLKESSAIEELPSGIGSLTNLRHLYIIDTEIRCLPAGIGKLTNLRISFENFGRILFVNSKGQCGIGVLKNFVNVQRHVYISGLWNLLNVDDVRDAGLEHKHELEELSLDWNEVDVDDLWYLDALRVQVERNDAELSEKNGLHLLEASPEPVDEEIRESMLEHLQLHANLKSLNIYNYGGSRFPKWLENPSSLPSLQQIRVSDCENIRSLPLLHVHDSLEMVEIFGCPQLASIAGLHNLHSLTNLKIYDCPRLQVLSVEGLPSNLRDLDIECQQLTSLQGMQNLASLRKLKIQNCSHLQLLLEEGLPPKLQDLHIEECQQLTSLSGIQNLTSLGALKIKNCSQLRLLSEEGLPSKLENLYIEGCQRLTLLSGIQNLTSLRELTIQNCPELLIMVEDQLSSMPDKVKIIDCPGLSNWCEKQKISCIQVPSGKKPTISEPPVDCVMIEHAKSVVSPISDAKDDCEMGQFQHLGLPSGCSSQSLEQITAEPSDAKESGSTIRIRKLEAQMEATRTLLEHIASLLQKFVQSQVPNTSSSHRDDDDNDHAPMDH